jgi:hypothetical protein
MGLVPFPAFLLRGYIRKLSWNFVDFLLLLVQAHVAVLDRLMCKVLTDVNVLGTLMSPNHLICQLDERRVVLEHRGVVRLAKLHIGQEGKDDL